MFVEAQVSIRGTAAAVWAVVTDIAGAAAICRGIESIELLATPSRGLVGLKWRETRMLFGKPASADKWITEAVEPEYFTTRAESDGFVFVTTVRLVAEGDGVRLTSSHDSLPQTLGARIMSLPMGLFFKGVARKAILQDLEDMKAAVERR